MAHLGPLNWVLIFTLALTSIMWGYVTGSQMTQKVISPHSQSHNFSQSLLQAAQAASLRLRQMHKAPRSK